MTWLTFAISAAVIVFAAIKLAEFADTIAIRTGLGGMFIGTLLLAGATSLPELLGAINSINQGVPNLAAGDILGSSMMNMLILAIADVLAGQARILRQTALRHALTASMAVLLSLMVAFFLLGGLDVRIGWIGIDSLLLIGAYVAGVWLIRNSGQRSAHASSEPIAEGLPSLLKASIGFLIAAGALVGASPWLVRSSTEIAVITGLSMGFVGTTLVAVATSLPELITVLVAVRMGAFDLAVGDLFGSNLFNMFALGLADVFYTKGRFLGAIDPRFALIALLGAILTALGLIGNLAQVKRRLLVIEADALLIMAIYALGLWFLYTQGIGV
jgi:cation:H+ antiporter